MPDGPRSTNRTDNIAAEGTPRWVKVSAAIALVVVVLAIILLVTGRGGEHGPGRHGSASSPGHAQP